MTGLDTAIVGSFGGSVAAAVAAAVDPSLTLGPSAIIAICGLGLTVLLFVVGYRERERRAMRDDAIREEKAKIAVAEKLSGIAEWRVTVDEGRRANKADHEATRTLITSRTSEIESLTTGLRSSFEDHLREDERNFTDVRDSLRRTNDALAEVLGLFVDKARVLGVDTMMTASEGAIPDPKPPRRRRT